MCGRFSLDESNWSDYHAALSNVPALFAQTSYNIKPTQNVPIVYNLDGALASTHARWWFVPHWHKGLAKDWKATTFNAKIETAFEKPTFRDAWRNGHCAIPATGYYEWTGEKGNKQPWHITISQNAPVFFFAGLYSRLYDDTYSCTILTREAMSDTSDIHHRMPVILADAEIEPWLNGKMDDTFAINELGCSWHNKFEAVQVNPFKRDDDGVHMLMPKVET